MITPGSPNPSSSEGFGQAFGSGPHLEARFPTTTHPPPSPPEDEVPIQKVTFHLRKTLRGPGIKETGSMTSCLLVDESRASTIHHGP